MSICEYKCEKCGYAFATIIAGPDDQHVLCPKCRKNKVRRMCSYNRFLDAANGHAPGAVAMEFVPDVSLDC